MRKNIFISGLLIALLSFWGCEKNDQLTISGDVAQNEMQSLSQSSYVLTLDQADQTFETFKWSAPDYGFPAVINYTVQADVAGNNFASVFDVAEATHDTQASITVAGFNKKMLEAGLSPDTPYDMEFRIKSDINDNVDPLYSTVKTCSVTAYATDFPPIYMIGPAVGDWDLTKAVVMYTTGAPGVYSIICEWTQDGAFRFFDEPSWDAVKQWNWTFFEGGSVSADFESANDGDTNLKFIGTSGWYRITVDFSTKSIGMESVEKPRRLLVGSAMPGGWDIGNPTELTFVSDGVYTCTTEFHNDNPTAADPENTFRVFWKNDWTAGWNYPYYVDAGYTISDLFEDAMDGDNNFRYTGGPTATYTFTLNEWEKTITMEAAK